MMYLFIIYYEEFYKSEILRSVWIAYPIVLIAQGSLCCTFATQSESMTSYAPQKSVMFFYLSQTLLIVLSQLPTTGTNRNKTN